MKGTLGEQGVGGGGGLGGWSVLAANDTDTCQGGVSGKEEGKGLEGEGGRYRERYGVATQGHT